MTPPGSAATAFGDLLKDAAQDDEGQEAPAPEPPAEAPPAEPRKPGTANRKRPRGGKKVAESTRPKYVAVRPDQQGDLDEVARDLMDARREKGGERITANSLIRVAIDALVAQRDQLTGDNEREIRVQYLKTLGVPENKIPKH